MSQIKVNSIIPVSGVPTGGGGGIIQIIQKVKTDVSSITVGEGVLTDLPTASVSDLNPQLTCTSSSSKVLVIPSITFGVNNTGNIYMTLTVDGSVTTFRGDASGNRQRISSTQRPGASTGIATVSGMFLYSPGNTNQHTYSVALSHANDINQTIQINQGVSAPNQPYVATGISTITVMEVSA
tara:strand:- start:169 stop:714 length:546 start_codon:yes stop_codon:yes gene_type:complete